MWNLLALTPLLLPQDARDVEQVLALSSRGLSEVLVHPKDQGLRALLPRLEPALRHMLRELDGRGQIPVAAISVACRALLGPMQLSLGIRMDTEQGLPAPQVRWELPEPSADEAAHLGWVLGRLLSRMGLECEAPEAEGLVPAEGTPFPIRVGSKGTQALLLVGESTQELARLDAGEAFALDLEYGAFLRKMMELAGEDDPETAQARAVLADLGMLETRMIVRGEVRESDSRWTLRQTGLAKASREHGLLPEAPLAPEVLQAIPEDALWAQVGSYDSTGLIEYMLDLMGDPLHALGIQDPLAEFERASGFHLQRDFTDHLGTSYGLYASDTTGGGGIASTVLFLAVSHAEDMAETLDRVVRAIESPAGLVDGGEHVGFRVWQDGSQQYTTLVFPGLPIPLEPTWAIAGGYLLVGASPQATLGAVHQVLHAQTSLASNPSFVAGLPAERAGMVGFQFLDAPRYLRGGYAPMSFLCSMLTNAARAGGAEVPNGPLLPPYHALARDARATVGVTRVEGDDLVSEHLSDPSFAVGCTAALGFLIEGPIGPILALMGVVGASNSGGMSGLPIEIR